MKRPRLMCFTSTLSSFKPSVPLSLQLKMDETGAKRKKYAHKLYSTLCDNFPFIDICLPSDLLVLLPQRCIISSVLPHSLITFWYF